MKRMKKILSVILTLVMVLALAVPGFAASGTNAALNNSGSITISNAIPGKDYTIYKIFDLESYSYEDGKTNEEGAYAYKIDSTSTWYDFVTGTGAGAEYVTIENGYVTWKDGEDAAAFAKEALEYAKNRPIIPSENDTKTAGDAVEDETTVEVEFTGLALGYYLVDSSTGALCSLNTTNPTAEIEEKNDVPTVDKKILGEDNSRNETNSASIGDTVNFDVRIAVQPGAQNYVLHDKMDAGLAYVVDSVKVYMKDSINADVDENEDVEVEKSDTTYTVSTSNQDGCDLEVRFVDAYVAGLADKYLVIRYSATITEQAIINGENKNTVELSYGKHTTTESTTKTYVYDVDVFKYTGTSKTPLAGAKFTLSKKSDGTNPIIIAAVAERSNVYKVVNANLGESDTGETEIETDASGKFKIEGLAAGTYYLTETVAPNGYNKLSESIEVVIAENDGSVEVEGETATYQAGATLVNGVPVGENGVEVENKTGSLLPSTGGIGTTIFYAAGIILMAGAVFFVIRRRKAN